MSTENKIVGSITVSASFERDWKTYDAEVVFDLHEDGQRSLRKQSVTHGVYIVRDQDFEQEAYALMHKWDTRELEIELAQVKAERDRLREALERFHMSDHDIAYMRENEGDCWTDSILEANKVLRAAQEAARG